MQLSTYDIQIQHRPGATNGPPDALSRHPLDVTLNDVHDDELLPPVVSTISSTYSTQHYDDQLLYKTSDPGYLLLLDYFRSNPLPPSSLSIPISLFSISKNSTASTDSTIANIHFADNINLYEQIRAAQWNDSSLLPLLNFLQHQQVPTVDNLQKFYGLARLHRMIDGALYRIFHIRQSSHNQHFLHHHHHHHRNVYCSLFLLQRCNAFYN